MCHCLAWRKGIGKQRFPVAAERGGGDKKGLESFVASEQRRRQEAVGVTHEAIERKFSDDECAREIGADLLGGDEQADGGEIVRETFFWEGLPALG